VSAANGIQIATRTGVERRTANHRASLALLLGALGVAAIPAAVYVSQRSQRVGLLDAAWAIPVAFCLGVGALLFARGARGKIARSLERSGGRMRIRAARLLGVLAICIALSAAISVGFYELLLRLEG
jgi:hypothetical protein